jgi:hypothetical protein
VVPSHLNSGALGSGAGVAAGVAGVAAAGAVCANANMLAPAKLNIRNNFFIELLF